MKDKIKFGLAGCGYVANTHAEILTSLKETRLECLCDIDETKLKSYSSKFGIQKTFTNFNDMLNEKIDAVIIATPNWLHSKMVIEAAKAGKHVLVEKPLSITLEEADRAIKTCEDKDVKLSVVYQYRFCPPASKLRQLIDAGSLSKLILGFSHVIWRRDKKYFDDAPWRADIFTAGGGALLHQAIHMIDLLQWYFGPVDFVQAYVNRIMHDIKVEDVATGLLMFKNGALATILATTAASTNFPPIVGICSSKGTVSIENFKEGGIVKVSGFDPSIFNANYPNFSCNSEIPIYAKNHAAQIVNFISAIKGADKLIVDGKEARKSLDIVLKMYESSGINLRRK